VAKLAPAYLYAKESTWVPIYLLFLAEIDPPWLPDLTFMGAMGQHPHKNFQLYGPYGSNWPIHLIFLVCKIEIHSSIFFTAILIALRQRVNGLFGCIYGCGNWMLCWSVALPSPLPVRILVQCSGDESVLSGNMMSLGLPVWTNLIVPNVISVEIFIKWCKWHIWYHLEVSYRIVA